MDDRQPRNRRQFTAEFKRDAVDLVRQRPADRPDRPRAGHLRLHPGELGRQDRIDRGEQDGLTSDEQLRRGELERENARCGWSVTCSNEPSPSGSPNSRHRDALPRCRFPEGRRILGRRSVTGWLCFSTPAPRSARGTPEAGLGRGDPPSQSDCRDQHLAAGHRRPPAEIVGLRLPMSS